MAGRFSALQVEVTSRCNASCACCPRTVFREGWVSKDMSMELFTRIASEIDHDIDVMYLQGWGEPLLNPNIADMIKLAKSKPVAIVGLTTNGTLLNEHVVENVLDAGLDLVGTSFAGAESESHNELRRGCDFDRVVKNTEALVRMKRQREDDVRVVASYIMTRQNAREVPEFVRLCEAMGIDEIMLDNLTYTPTEECSASKAFHMPVEKQENRNQRYLEEGRDLARRAGIRLFAYGLECRELATCPEDPARSMFVNVEGEVSPCVFTNLPKRDSMIQRCFGGRPASIEKVVFGNAGVEGLDRAWYGDGYRRFREAFERRRRMADDAADLFAPVLEPSPEAALPECCRTCYRVLGV